MFKQIHCQLRFQTRKCSRKVERKIRPSIILDENTNELIKSDQLKPRKHEGKVSKAPISLPIWVTKAMSLALEGHPKDIVMKDATDLHRHLFGKLPPPEENMMKSKYQEISDKLKEELESTNDDEREVDDTSPEIHNKTMKLMALKIRPWASIQYDSHRSLMYMLAKGAFDYAVLCKIFGEIKSRDKEFRPKTLLDFGSGIGTVSWVTSAMWPDSLKERMCIDISTEINDLAEKLIKHASPKIKSTAFHRQYLPVGAVPTFDIVVSAFSLMELPSRKLRIDTIASLWRKTGKYLVLVECGTKGGWQIIAEAREFILQLIAIQKRKDPKNGGIIAAPCPHDLACPKYATDEDVCKFEARYNEVVFNKHVILHTNRYTYVVFKKDAERGEKDLWPRVVRPVLVRSGHTICRMCTSEGKLQEIIFSKSKHERPIYRCGRASYWGDRLPIKIETPESE